MNSHLKQKMAPIHPGEILKEELLIPRGISQSQLAQSLKISFRRISIYKLLYFWKGSIEGSNPPKKSN